MADTLMFYPRADLEAHGHARYFRIFEIYGAGGFLLEFWDLSYDSPSEHRRYDSLKNAMRAAERMNNADIKREQERMKAFEEGITEEVPDDA